MDICAAVCDVGACYIVWTHVLLCDVGTYVWTHVLLCVMLEHVMCGHMCCCVILEHVMC